MGPVGFAGHVRYPGHGRISAEMTTATSQIGLWYETRGFPGHYFKVQPEVIFPGVAFKPTSNAVQEQVSKRAL